ncbi:ferredoxin reductase family protein [Nocardioides sp. BE266]|uniref:ferredoxin reductase family protein n=1 Tax=Nocardioides sp. BE266 TaxID=2817725 RepID=UPI00286CFA6C|nr:ferredoxin reductase family protein [Nocardioides sp. BE266]
MAVTLLVTAPVVVLATAPDRVGSNPWERVSLVTSLAAASLLLVAFVLPSRLRAITTYLGVERVLRSHRLLALVAAALVVIHVASVLGHAGPGVLDLRTAPPRVWAATVATLALLAMVPLAMTRRKRRPRYEGWRLLHVALGNLVLFGTALHVFWLHDLTSYRWGAAWFAGLLVGLLLLTAYRWMWRPWRSHQTAYVVDEVRVESASAVTVAVHADGHAGVDFRPGQFAWLKLGESAFVFEEHPFTIASAATRPWRKEFTVKALGDFSEILAGLRPGRRVHLDGPHGAFTLDGLRSDGFVFVAGGVGITPMLSMLRTMADRGDRRPVLLVVAGRTADDLLHRADHEHLGQRLDLRLVEVLEEPPEEWDGEVGWLTRDVLASALPGRRGRAHLDYFVCGPGPMVAAATRILEDDWGVPDRRIHTELFDVV